MSEQSSSSQDNARSAPQASTQPAPSLAANDASMAVPNVKSFASQNAVSDVFATMNNAVKDVYQNNMLRNASNYKPLDRDVAEVIDTSSQENPVYKQLRTRIKDDSEALHVVDAVLKKLFSGAKLMHMPPDAIQAIVGEAYAHVAEYQTHKEHNPNLDIGHLVMTIGPGSHFFATRHQMIVEHHPEHESYLDDMEHEGGHSGHDHHAKDKKARLRHAQSRPVQPQDNIAFGYPTGRSANDAVAAAAVVVAPENDMSADDIAEHTQDIHDRHMGDVPKTVVDNATHHGFIEAALHLFGLH